jgi:hypothetical protein
MASLPELPGQGMQESVDREEYGECAERGRFAKEVAVTVPMASCDAGGPPGASGKEHRRSHRYSCNGSAEVMVVHPECLFRGEIRDISENGCFLVTRARVQLKRLDEAEVRFGLNNCQLKVQARVMSVREGDGLGFEFLDLSPRTKELLSYLIQELAQKQGSCVREPRDPVGPKPRVFKTD